ncbi:MAG: N-6 DNA methylase [Panacagrimonas sp.]
MIGGELKSDINRLWLAFHTGGVTNPLTVIEQISFLMFARLLDITESRNEKRATHTGKSFRKVFTEDQQPLRWQHFRHLGGEQMLPLVRDKVFPHFKDVAALETEDGTQRTTFHEYFKDAQLMIQKPSLLTQAVEMVNELPLTEGDVKGDLYEYLLSKLTTAGINGQFRTPRHIIDFMVELADVQPTDTLCDPACGTGGFLARAMEYLMRTHSSPEGIVEMPAAAGEEAQKIYSGDLLEEHREHIRTKMFTGFDFDATMLRVAAMNLLLHGVEAPNIHYQDTLGNSFTDKFPKLATDAFEVILANPPFKGTLDAEDVHPSLLRVVKTKKTELLFLALILRMLKVGGRAAVIVPDGVLFGSSKAHQDIRQKLVEEHQLEAVISLPSGVFKPYAGVSTGIVLFTKGGRTDEVFFCDVQSDGFSLDDKRQKIANNDLPAMLAAWKAWKDARGKDNKKKPFADRTCQAFYVPADEIRGNKFDLSINRYKEIVYAAEQFDPPKEILGRMKMLEKEILADLTELEGML